MEGQVLHREVFDVIGDQGEVIVNGHSRNDHVGHAESLSLLHFRDQTRAAPDTALQRHA
jgi:hypothetical protein